MALGSGVTTVVAEVSTNRMAPVLSSTELTHHHSKPYNLRPEKYFRFKLENLFVRRFY